MLVLGLGLVGNLALQLSKLSGGLPVVGVDLYDFRLEVARRCGADETLNPAKVDLKGTVLEATDGKGADVVIETTGSPEAIPLAFELAKPRRRVVLLGSTRGVTTVNFYSLVHRKGLVVIGAHDSVRPAYESSRRFWTRKDEVKLFFKLVEKKLLNVRDLITDALSPDRAPEAYDKLINAKERTLGVILG